MQSRLIEYLARIEKLDAEFIIYDDGYRGRSYRYSDVGRMAHSLRSRFRVAGLKKGDAVALWSESRAGWVATLWACLLEGIVLVPVDPQSSAALFQRIARKSQAKIALAGERVASTEDS